MLRRDHHIGRAEQRVGPRRVNAQTVVARFSGKTGFAAGGFSSTLPKYDPNGSNAPGGILLWSQCHFLSAACPKQLSSLHVVLLLTLQLACLGNLLKLRTAQGWVV